MPDPDHVVVVGASAAGLTAAETLRREGFTGTLTMVGDEPHPPYDRPPLSKQVLAGGREPRRATLRSDTELQRLGIQLESGCRATALDPAARTVTLGGTDRLRYDGLIIATGLRPRRLPFGHDLAGVHVLRTLDDALALRAHLLRGPRVVVIGAGFLGSEIAATARGLGLDVALVDVGTAPMARQIGPDIGRLAARLHQEQGVRLHPGRSVTGIRGSGGAVTDVVLDDGTRLPADAVVAAIGSVPATGWLADSGIPLDNGVRCDATCRAVPGVYAAGDVANWPDPRAGRVRLEQRTNATQQAITAARNLLADPGRVQPYTPTPFGWTDLYDTKIQIHGWCPPGAQVDIVDGDPAARRFVALYRTGGRVVGALGWNSPRALLHYRGHLAEPAVPAPRQQGALL